MVTATIRRLSSYVLAMHAVIAVF